MKFEQAFTIVSLKPGFINVKPIHYTAVNLTPYEARRMAEHLMKIVLLLEDMDASLTEQARLQHGGPN